MKKIAVAILFAVCVMTASAQMDTRQYTSDIERYIQRQDLKLLVRSGLMHFETGDYVLSRNELEEAIGKGVDLPEIYNYLGLIYDRFENYDRSIACYEKALLVDPKFIPARINKAVALFNRNDLTTAEEQLKRLFGEYPDMFVLKYNLGVLYLKRGDTVRAESVFSELMNSSYDHKARVNVQLAYIAAKRNNTKKMEDEISKAFFTDRYDPYVYYMSGLMYMQLDDFSQARIYFNQALTLNKNYPRALFQLASLEYIEGNLQAAIGYMERAITLVPENIDFLLRLGDLYSAQRDFKKADGYFAMALKYAKESDKAKTYGYMIVYNVSRNEMAQAQATLLQAKKEFPINPFVEVAEYFLFLDRNIPFDYDRAMQSIRKQSSVLEDYPLGYLVYGEILRNVDEKTAAIQQIKEGIKVSPAFYRMRFTLANIYRDTRLYKEAIDEYGKYLKVYPANGPAYNGMALTYIEMGNLAKAEETLVKGISKSPEYAPLYSNLGHVYVRQGKNDSAMVAYDKALAVDPNLSEAWNNKIVLLIDTKQYDKSIAVWNTIKNKWPNDPGMKLLEKKIAQIKDIIDWAQKNKQNDQEKNDKKTN